MSSSFKPYELFNHLRGQCVSVIDPYFVPFYESLYFSLRECIAAAYENSYHIWSRYEQHVLSISFPFVLTCSERMRYCKWRSSEKECSPSQQDDKQDSMHRQYLSLWCSLVTGNIWSYIANKPLYLFAPIFKLLYSLSKLHLNTKVHAIFQTTSHSIMQSDQICCPGEAYKFWDPRAVRILKEGTHNYFSLLTENEIFFPKIYVGCKKTPWSCLWQLKSCSCSM